MGELLSKGGRKLTKAEMTALYVAGATASETISRNGRRMIEARYDKDGYISGRSTDEAGRDAYGLTGTWTINDAGQLCVRMQTAGIGRDVTPDPACTFQFVLGELHFSSRSVDPGAPVFARHIKK